MLATKPAFPSAAAQQLPAMHGGSMRNALKALTLAIYSAGIPAALVAQAQPAMSGINVLSIYRETVKPGKGPEHDAHEEAWARAAEAAMKKSPVPMLAIT